MRLFKRTYLSLAGYIEELVKIIENHDSLSQAVIFEFEEKYAEARVRMETLKKEREKIETAATQAAENAERWERRAIEVSVKDKEQALECLKRKKNKNSEAKELRKQLLEFQRAEEGIQRDLQILAAKLQELKTRRNVLRAREARSEVLVAAGKESVQGIRGLDGIFDEWEQKLVREEVRGTLENAPAAAESYSDDLEKSFVANEEKTALEAELAQLLEKGQ